MSFSSPIPDSVRLPAGVIKADVRVRFGFHNFRHSLASALVKLKRDPKTVQGLLRHEDVRTTMQLYAQSDREAKLEAQGKVPGAVFVPVQVRAEDAGLKRELQELLVRKGFDPGEPNGRLGPKSRAAVRDYQASIGLVPDGFASATILAKLRGR